MPPTYDSIIRPFEPVEPDYEQRRYFNAVTITYGELVDMGFIDWQAPDWQWASRDPEQKARVESLIAGRYWLREISVIPPDAWRRALIQKLNEAMRQAAPMYEALEKTPSILAAGDEYHKRRTVASDFPQTLLNGTEQDYASSGVDLEYETVTDAGGLDVIERLQAGGYKDPDLWILDQLEVCFSKLVSVNINGF